MKNEKNANSQKLIASGSRGKLPTNKLTAYLIKEGAEDSYLNERAEEIKQYDDGKSKLYRAKSFSKPPKFMEQFFHESDDSVFSSSAQVLLVLNDVGSYHRTIAFTFGNGRCLMNQDAIERRFGLKAALNLIDPDSVKKFSKTKMDSNPKNENAQLAKKSKVAEFGIDISQDLIKGVSGSIKTKYITEFGKNVSGTDSLNLRVACDITNIRNIAKSIAEVYYNDAYKETFGWIDQIQEVKDKGIKQELDNKVIEELKRRNDYNIKIWASIPDFIDDEDLDGFRVGKNEGEPVDDISKEIIIQKLNGKIDLSHLKNLYVFAVSATSEIPYLGRWNAYRCLYAEIPKDDELFLLLDGSWYAVNNEFVKEVQDDFDNITYSEAKYTDYNHKDEAAYNKALAKSLGAKCYDASLITLAGYDKIELCDVLTKEGNLIHVKKYAGSSVLSHHFNQGLVSGELLVSNSKFKQKVKEKTGRDAGEMANKKIIFGIITKKPDKFNMPFFSKVSFNNVRRRLLVLGYKVEVSKINNVKPELSKK